MPDGSGFLAASDAVSEAARLNRLYADRSAEALLSAAIMEEFRGRIALVSSFGADAIVLLHMISRIDPATPVLMLETGMLFPETLAYQEQIADLLGLADVRLIRPDATDAAMLDPDGGLHAVNSDGCCYIRKTLPLRRALTEFDASITGRKRHQASTRAALPLAEGEARTGHVKLNPLAAWSGPDVADYIGRHDLPRHPLVEKGYPSIGCAPCTTPVAQGEDPRAGRWRGQGKVECGIHFDGREWLRTRRGAGVSRAFE